MCYSAAIMLKRLWGWKYFACIVLVFGGAVYVSHQYQRTRTECQEECQHINPKDVPPAAPTKNCDKCQEDTERNFPSWYRLVSWPEGIGAWAVLLTLLAIAEQTSETRRAATGAVDAAEAARQTIQLTKHMQRGRIGIVARLVDENIPNLIRISGRNIGSTNVKVFSARGYMATLQTLPEKPPYLSDKVNTRMTYWIAPGDELPVNIQEGDTDQPLVIDLRGDANRNNLRFHGDALWVYGRISYEDGISPEIREKRFCYSVRVDDEDTVDLVASGPADYWMDT
jgi:hypothetical protein